MASRPTRASGPEAAGLAWIVRAMVAGAAAQHADEPVVRFCFNDWPPYSRSDESGPHGISVDVLREAHAAHVQPLGLEDAEAGAGLPREGRIAYPQATL